MEGTEEQIVKPALQGTEFVLKACRDFELKKCIFTSSIIAIEGNKDVPEVVDDTQWADATSEIVDNYQKSKTLAERLIWDFRKSLPEESKLELVSMNPGFIVGTLFYIFLTCKI